MWGSGEAWKESKLDDYVITPGGAQRFQILVPDDFKYFIVISEIESEDGNRFIIKSSSIQIIDGYKYYLSINEKNKYCFIKVLSSRLSPQNSMELLAHLNNNPQIN